MNRSKDRNISAFCDPVFTVRPGNRVTWNWMENRMQQNFACRRLIFVSDRESDLHPICMKSDRESDREWDAKL
jgi:hypothetical protein